ncbi:9400_t:CDS:2, partial [Funneliformis mosseae]
ERLMAVIHGPIVPSVGFVTDIHPLFSYKLQTPSPTPSSCLYREKSTGYAKCKFLVRNLMAKPNRPFVEGTPSGLKALPLFGDLRTEKNSSIARETKPGCKQLLRE